MTYSPGNDNNHDGVTALKFLSGGGQMGELMRAYDWSTSPLGSPRTWPSALRTAVGMMINSDFPMFVAWGPELGFLYNDAYVQILGRKHPEALGQKFHEIWFEIWDDINPLIVRALAGHSTYHENLPLVMLRNGYEENTWFTFAYSPIYDETGDVNGMYCTCVETTESVLAEKYRNDENERFRALFEQAPGFMAILRSPEHVFELTNVAYNQLVGHRDVIGRRASEALPEVVEQGFIKLLDDVYSTGEPFVGRAIPIKLQREPNGPLEERFLDFVYQPIRDTRGNVAGIFAEGNDVTERVQAVEELRTANRQKDQFLAMLAHELRNPLSPIISAAELLKTAGLGAKGIENASSVIARQANHMRVLIDDLLDVSRVTRGLITLTKEELDVKAVVSNAVEQTRNLVETRRHQLNLQMTGEPAHVTGDRTRLVQVVSNILNNAARYTPPGGAIVLSVTAEEAHVEISVRDNGMGITREALPYVFDLFTQGDRALDRSSGGLGIGLALVKNLVDLHGGMVEVLSDGPNLGAEVRVRLPRTTQVRTGTVAVQEANQFARSMRVLIVDDNVDAAQTLAMLLEVAGHTVAVEHNSYEALKHIRTNTADILLLDIGLPDIDGYELARQVRQTPELDQPILVAVTGYGQWEDRERSKAAGFDYHLVKPVEVNELMRILSAACG